MKAYKLHVDGIVQAVGFRPFIYRLAHEYGLKGYVRNLGDAGVEIHVEGDEKRIKDFIADITDRKPPAAEIRRIIISEAKIRHFKDFNIIKSSYKGGGGESFSIIPPDIAICNECLRELFDPNDRRYLYPFITCTNCGPRFTIIEDIPYDRANTTMRDFPLCDDCKKEYEDPLNRRYHAEPISCPKCGPKYTLYNNHGVKIDDTDPLRTAARLIDEGFIVAIKGIGGIHLACDATNEEAVLELRRRTLRPQKPFAVMAANIETIREFAHVNNDEYSELTSYRRPIVILRKKKPFPLAKSLAPGLHTIGAMLPYTGTHYILFHYSKSRVYVMTSANMPGRPMVKDNEKVFEKLDGMAEYFLLHNMRIANRNDDSVVRFVDGGRSIIRRSRGFVPRPVKETVFKYHGLALGAELMNSFSFIKNGIIYPSQFIGDTSNVETVEYMREAINHFIKILRINSIDLVITDRHPHYNTTKLGRELAENYGAEVIQVQHHHAHIASILAEKGLDEIIGIAVDGVGYGLDRAIWGGEIILISHSTIKRLGHIKYYPLPGGDRASLYPLRALIGILSNIYTPDEIRSIITEKCPKSIDALPYKEKEFEIILQQIENKVNTPVTSSTGRILDAFSVLFNVCYKRTYEGEPAMKLESLGYKGKPVDLGSIPVTKSEIVLEELFREVIESDKNIADLAYSVHTSIAKALAELAVEKALEYGVKNIGVSGGVAYNELIVRNIRETVEENGLRFYATNDVPRGDNGISAGQLVLGGLYYEGLLKKNLI